MPPRDRGHLPGHVHRLPLCPAADAAPDRGDHHPVGSALAYRAFPSVGACTVRPSTPSRGPASSPPAPAIHHGSNVRRTTAQMPATNTPQFGWVKPRLPRKGQPVPPSSNRRWAARAIVWAAFDDRREIYVGWPTVQAIVGNKFASGWLDHYSALVLVNEAQMTDEPEDPTRRVISGNPSPATTVRQGPSTIARDAGAGQLWADLHRQWIALAGAGLAGLAVGLVSQTLPRPGPGKFFRTLMRGT